MGRRTRIITTLKNKKMKEMEKVTLKFPIKKETSIKHFCFWSLQEVYQT